MTIAFYKYQGTGNDFVMIDNREGNLPPVSTKLVQTLCDRKFGVGADGFIVLENHPTLDFTMHYWNADGSQSFCGNGSRCAVAFAKRLGVIEQHAHFLSTDGEHEAEVLHNGWVSLHMHDVNEVEKGEDYLFINTGSPHYIQTVSNTEEVDVVAAGQAVRYNDRFKGEGTNVNFLERGANEIRVRTYERGVEDETLSCGTGVTACAIAAHQLGWLDNDTCSVTTQGGQLRIRLKEVDGGYQHIRLEGPATFVFSGTIAVG